MNAVSSPAIVPATQVRPQPAGHSITMQSLVIHWLAKVVNQRATIHDGFMAYGRYVKNTQQINRYPGLKLVFDGLIKSHNEDAQEVAHRLLSYFVQQNIAPINVARQAATARTAMRFRPDLVAEELKLLVRCADAGKPPAET